MAKNKSKTVVKATNELELQNKIIAGASLVGEEIYDCFHASKVGKGAWVKARKIFSETDANDEEKDPLGDAVDSLMDACKAWMGSLSSLHGELVFEKNSDEISECFYAGLS